MRIVAYDWPIGFEMADGVDGTTRVEDRWKSESDSTSWLRVHKKRRGVGGDPETRDGWETT